MPHHARKQGQYLAFIYSYTKINRRAPAEVDMQHFFNVTPPTIQQMILTIEKSEFISREPGKARTIKVLLPPGSTTLSEVAKPYATISEKYQATAPRIHG